MEALEQSGLPVKKYPFRFTPLMLALFFIGLVLCLAGFGLTLWRFLGFLRNDPEQQTGAI